MNGILKLGKEWFTNSYHIGRVLIGLGTLAGDFYIYLNFYLKSSSTDLGMIIVFAFFFGIAMLSGGLDGWKRIHEQRERVERISLKVEYEKKKKELENIKKPEFPVS